MTQAVLVQKIESLRNCVERIESKKPFSAMVLETNFDLQDIIERAVQSCVDIATHLLAEKKGPTPNTMAESFVLLAQEGVISKPTAETLAKSVGLRNILVQEYSKTNWKIVASVANSHLDTFRDFAREVLK